jgi:hypothetical protein
MLPCVSQEVPEGVAVDGGWLPQRCFGVQAVPLEKALCWWHYLKN